MFKGLLRLGVTIAGYLGTTSVLPHAALGQSLQVMPISISLQPGQTAATLAVTNKGATTATLQLRPFEWSVRDDKDVLQSTQLLAVSPPITQVAAGQTQTFRLLLRQAPVGSEASYRMLLDELPSPAEAGMVRVALRLSIPVFVKPTAHTLADVSWRALAATTGFWLIARNAGGEHARLVNLMLTQGSGLRLNVKSSGSSYVLPNAERRWQVEDSSRLQPGSALHLTALSDNGPINAVVPITAW